MSLIYTDKFGYLPIAETLEFEGGSVSPVPEIFEVIQAVSKHAHPDGHVYPPLARTLAHKPGWKRFRKVPQSNRPALFHKLPPTHFLKLEEGFASQDQARYGAAGFLIHFIGFLYGFRCQFHDWWMDGRVLTKSQADHSNPRAEAASRIVERALQRWRQYSERQRLVAINALFLHSRTHVYEMTWERLQAEYQVFDAVFALARDTGQIAGIGKIPHGDRIATLCGHFEIPMDAEKIALIVRLRNDLLHEALWDGRMPGEARSQLSFYTPLWIHRLTKRAFLAVLGFEGKYIRAPWWTLGSFYFDVQGKPLRVACVH